MRIICGERGGEGGGEEREREREQYANGGVRLGVVLCVRVCVRADVQEYAFTWSRQRPSWKTACRCARQGLLSSESLAGEFKYQRET